MIICGVVMECSAVTISSKILKYDVLIYNYVIYTKLCNRNSSRLLCKKEIYLEFVLL